MTIKSATATIAGIIVKKGRSPRAQLFLIFTDHTYTEFFSQTDEIHGGNVYPGDAAEVRRYQSETQQVIFEAPPPTPQADP